MTSVFNFFTCNLFKVKDKDKALIETEAEDKKEDHAPVLTPEQLEPYRTRRLLKDGVNPLPLLTLAQTQRWVKDLKIGMQNLRASQWVQDRLDWLMGKKPAPHAEDPTHPPLPPRRDTPRSQDEPGPSSESPAATPPKTPPEDSPPNMRWAPIETQATGTTTANSGAASRRQSIQDVDSFIEEEKSRRASDDNLIYEELVHQGLTTQLSRIRAESSAPHQQVLENAASAPPDLVSTPKGSRALDEDGDKEVDKGDSRRHSWKDVRRTSRRSDGGFQRSSRVVPLPMSPASLDPDNTGEGPSYLMNAATMPPDMRFPLTQIKEEEGETYSLHSSRVSRSVNEAIAPLEERELYIPCALE